MQMKTIIATLLLLPFVLPATGQQRHGDGLDDVLQHVPLATVLTLRTCGVNSSSASLAELVGSAAASYALSAATAYSLKHACREQRPDKSDRRSLPSGHATLAFSGATVLMHEYGHVSPWIAVGGYTLATFVSADRVCRDRHYVHDVCAGAAIGFGMTELTYWLKNKLLKNRNVDVSFSGQRLDLTLRW